jgi:GMP synthase-like glutamine amidotransferase
MHLCIYEADRPTPEDQARFGSYADMFERWLAPALPQARFSRAFVAGGEAPPDPGSVDAVLITGARAGVHDGDRWIADLKDHLGHLRTAGTPMAGICFGHQLMAEAFGGKVARATAGWTVGRHLHGLTPAGRALFGAAPVAALSFHQDQVVSAPPDATALLSSAQSPLGGFRYDFEALSVQVHPELEPEYVRGLLTGTAVGAFPRPFVEASLATLGAALDADRLAQGFARFFQGRATGGPDHPGAGHAA